MLLLLVTNGLSLVTRLVGLGRFELPTSPLSGVRSNQLSYRPKSNCQLWRYLCFRSKNLSWTFHAFVNLIKKFVVSA